MERPNYDHSFTLTSDKVWEMEKTHEFPPDFESHYRGLINLIDFLSYRNGVSYYHTVKSRHAAFFVALAMPSYAYIDPHRTLEMKYNLHAAAIAIENEGMTDVQYPYNSERMRTLEAFATLAMYKLVSEKTLNDKHMHELAEKVYERIVENGASEQHTYAYDTIEGTYQVYPNALALLAFEIHDRYFGTDYSKKIQENVLAFITDKLVDKDTGLFSNYYKTGSLGYPGEHLSEMATWSGKTPDASANALGITFMNHFNPEQAGAAWEVHKQVFTDKLLMITSEQLADTQQASYLSQVNPTAEGLYATLLAAKEMNDKEYFEKIQNHLMKIALPEQREGKVFFDGAGDEQFLHGNFLAFARVHVGWDKLLNHPWEKYYKFDYNKVR